jgi:TetR/AcrR family transcriptional regulator, transcriptional repressor for nem operon
MSQNAREQILAAGKRIAQAHGYAGLNFRDLAQEVGIKAASIYYHFPSKAELAAAVAKRYWQDAEAYLDQLLEESPSPKDALRRYPETFRWALESANRMCLCSFMGAEVDDVPESVRKEIRIFADVNIAWLSKVLSAANLVPPQRSQHRAQAIFAAVVGAQLAARTRADISVYDQSIENYQAAGLLPE